MRINPFIAGLALLVFIEPVAALDGQMLFSQHCAQCHGATLGGSAHGTALKGPVFQDKWVGQNGRRSPAFPSRRCHPENLIG